MPYTVNTLKVEVNGQDVTSRFAPFLKTCDIDRSDGEASDKADILIRNDNRIVLPEARAPVRISINGTRRFDGFVSEVSVPFDPDSGTEIKISASSVDQGSKVKEACQRHMDDASLTEVAQAWGSKAGLSVTVAGSITSINREYWYMQNESYLSWAERIAKEIGATFKVSGTRAFFVGKNEGLSATGQPIQVISAAYGVNLLGGEVTPVISRPDYNQAEIGYFDVDRAEYLPIRSEGSSQTSDAAFRTPVNYANESQAREKAGAINKDSDREKGDGNVTILGTTRSEPGGFLALSGIRPGVDGQYLMATVKDRFTTGGGYTNYCSLKAPREGAGEDSR